MSCAALQQRHLAVLALILEPARTRLDNYNLQMVAAGVEHHLIYPLTTFLPVQTKKHPRQAFSEMSTWLGAVKALGASAAAADESVQDAV